MSLTEKPTFSVKIIRNPIKCCICIGVALDSSRFNQTLHSAGWCIYSHYALECALGKCYFGNKSNILENQIVTVSVNFTHKEISYEVDGQAAGPHYKMSLTDAEMLRLRPIVQIWYQGDSVEIVNNP